MKTGKTAGGRVVHVNSALIGFVAMFVVAFNTVQYSQ